MGIVGKSVFVGIIALGFLLFASYTKVINIKEFIANNFSTKTVSANRYVSACMNYALSAVATRYEGKLIIYETDLKNVTISSKKLKIRDRIEISDKTMHTNVVEVNDLRVMYRNDTSYVLSCWINKSFQGDPSDITSYDVLRLSLKSVLKNTKDLREAILEENY